HWARVYSVAEFNRGYAPGLTPVVGAFIQQCCRIETNPGRNSSCPKGSGRQLNHRFENNASAHSRESGNPRAKGRRQKTCALLPLGRVGVILPAGADHLDVEIADLLAQGVAVDAEQVGGTDLVAARGGERGREQRLLHLAQDAMVKAG